MSGPETGVIIADPAPVFAALGDATRLELISRLSDGRAQSIAQLTDGLGLTRQGWPEEQGGWLEFYGPDKQTVIERRPPGFDTLDLYDVHPVERWHGVPLLLEQAQERLTISGWLGSQGEP